MKRGSIALMSLAMAISGSGLEGQERRSDSEERARRQAAQWQTVADRMATPRPIEALNSVWIEELTWMEVRDALAEGKRSAIIATGGIEQNGPYLATGKHNYVLEGACEGIARALGDALCAPIIKLVPEGPLDGSAAEMMYPGTISLRESTFEAVLEDVGTSLRVHGFDHIFFIGDSGKNQDGMRRVADRLNERWRTGRAYYIPEFYRYRDVFAWMETELGIEELRNDGIHDDYVITSIMMANDPTTVRYEQRMAADLATINGLSIADKEKTQEIGRKLLGFRIDSTVEAIRRVMSSTEGR